MDPDDTGRPSRGTVRITPEADPALLPVLVEAPAVPMRRGLRWGAVFWAAVGGLVLLGVGLGVTELIEDLFARSESLGFLGLAFAVVAALALAVVVVREALGLARLAAIEKHASARDSRAAQRRSRRKPGHRAGSAQDRASEPATGAGARLAAGHADDIIDGADSFGWPSAN